FDPNRVDYATNIDNIDLSLQSLRLDGRVEYRLNNRSLVYVGGGLQSGTNELYGVASLRNQQIDGEKFSVRAGYESKDFTLRTFYSGNRLTSGAQFFPTSLSDLGSNVRFDLVSAQPIYRPEFELGGKHALILGGEYRFKYIEWDYLNDQQQEDHFAVFFQDIWTLSESLSLNISARLDLHPIIGPLGSPRLAVIYKPTSSQAIRLSLGTAFRQPTMAETYLDLASNSPIAASAVALVGLRELDPERIATVELGYRYRSDFLDVEAVGYVNRITNLIVRSPLEATGANARFDPDLGAFVVAQSLYLNDPRAFIAVGSELSARFFPVDGVDFGANYTLQYIFDEASGDRFTDSPVHKVSVWGFLRTAVGLDLGVSGHFVSSQDWVEPEFDPADPTGFNTDPLRVDASVVVIARAGLRLLDDQLEVAISGVNLLDFGELRHREHPFGNQLEARVIGSLTARF
ncbi:MAG: TonB-dependent receptor, partial [Myxococcota bacterium]